MAPNLAPTPQGSQLPRTALCWRAGRMRCDCCSAEALVRAEMFDLLMLDLNLPQMDGLTVLRSMRQRANPAAVLVLTARGAPEGRVRGLGLGAA
ncbi:MAG: response regulator, partial [Pseudorhodobacter sp.]|nr:response regulator [Pseudorhodobacter sp.]